MLNEYQYEVEIMAFNEAGDLVQVHIPFDIDEDEDAIEVGEEVRWFKSYSIDRGPISARNINLSRMYVPTAIDLREWESDIRAALQKETKRQVA